MTNVCQNQEKKEKRETKKRQTEIINYRKYISGPTAQL